MTATTEGQERIRELMGELAAQIGMEAYTANDERWDLVTALLRVTGEVMPRGLGMFQAWHAVQAIRARSEGDWPADGLQAGAQYEAVSLLGVATHPWIALAATRWHARHRASFERYRVHDARLPGALPEIHAEWDAWALFFEGIERGAYGSGASLARVYLAGAEPTEDEMREARVAALVELRRAFESHRDILGKACQVPPAAPLVPTPEEAQTAPQE